MCERERERERERGEREISHLPETHQKYLSILELAVNIFLFGFFAVFLKRLDVQLVVAIWNAVGEELAIELLCCAFAARDSLDAPVKQLVGEYPREEFTNCHLFVLLCCVLESVF